MIARREADFKLCTFQHARETLARAGQESGEDNAEFELGGHEEADTAIYIYIYICIYIYIY